MVTPAQPRCGYTRSTVSDRRRDDAEYLVQPNQYQSKAHQKQSAGAISLHRYDLQRRRVLGAVVRLV